jgi:GAF domain-containing protein
MSKSDDKPTLPELDLVESKREFIETFFKRGAEFTEELMRENEKLRFRVVQLEEERRALASSAQSPQDNKPGAGALRELVARIEQLEHEREGLMSRFAGVERQNRDFYDRYHDIERENNNLANLYVASFQLHSTMELRELTQIILEILLNFVGAKTFAIQLVDDDHGKFRTLAAEGVDRARVPEGAVTDGRVGEVVKSGHHYIDGERLRARADLAHLDRPVIVVPLKIRDKVVGVVIIWDLLSQKTALADVDYELFNLLAAHAASALQGAWLAAELKGRAPHLWAAADQV